MHSHGTFLATSAPVSIEARGHRAQMIYDFNWSPPVNLAQLVGLIRAGSSTRLAATVIRTQFNRGQLATLPVAAGRK